MSALEITLSGSALSGVAPQLMSSTTLAALPKTVKLGCQLAPVPANTPKLASYMTAEATVSLPASINRRDKAAQSIARMYMNDQLGCCVISGKAHALGVWSANDADSGGLVEATDSEIVQQYQAICGPGDNGCYITRVLDVMKTKGLVANGKPYTIDGYVSVNWRNQEEVKAALYLFGAVTLGINLPQAWTQNAIWDVTNSPNVGGHDVTAIDYDDKGVYVSSWGRIYLITWAAFTSQAYLMETYALLAPLWYGKDQVASANMINADKLKADLIAIGNGQIPSIDPTPVVPPVVPPPPLPPVVTYPTFNVTVSGDVPAGFFGRPTPVTLTGTAQAAKNRVTEPVQAAFPSIDSSKILPLLMSGFELFDAYSKGKDIKAPLTKLVSDLVDLFASQKASMPAEMGPLVQKLLTDLIIKIVSALIEKYAK